RLDLRWKQTDDIDARHVHQFAQLLKADFDIAACDERAHRNAGRSLDDARRNFVGDAPALEQVDKMRTARACRIPDAAGAQDGLASRRLARDVGWRRALGYRYRDS